MLLWFAALFSLIVGLVVVRLGEEQRVKRWFVFLCLSCAALAVGLWVEVNQPDWAIVAARVNMTAALLTAGAGLLSARAMMGFPVHRLAVALLAVAAVVNVATVWATDVYLTGELIRYRWGVYAAGDPRFVINPLLVVTIALYGVGMLVVYARRAHPLERNRAGYLTLAYAFLAMSLADYLPHFGIDLFGGSVSALAIPAFLATFGYACLRYRLLGFGELVGRLSGGTVVVGLVASVYLVTLEIGRRLAPADVGAAHVGAAATALALYATLGRAVSRRLDRWLGAAGRRIERAVAELGEELVGVLDEAAIWPRVEAICLGPLGSAAARPLQADTIAQDAELEAALGRAPLVEVEILRREGGGVPPALQAWELAVPVRHRERLLAALLVGPRRDHGMYSFAAVSAAKSVGNLWALALANAQAAQEVERRHRLDRFLPPQLVERMLGDEGDALVERRRVSLTIFFSDLKDFSATADRLDPDTLASVLNEYLSEMSEIAFAYGGTVDKFIGDAVMVLFGAPVQLPAAEQARSAVAMAASMQRRLRTLGERWVAEGRTHAPLTARMGIHTGEATVGSFGSLARADYTAIGRVVNLASRLEGACRPGLILVSADTWALVASALATAGRQREALAVKGFAEPVRGAVEIDPTAMDLADPPSDEIDRHQTLRVS